MFTLPKNLLPTLLPFAPLFSHRTFSRAYQLAVGAILAPAARTVTQVLRILAHENDPLFGNYHRVLNRARWSVVRTARILLRMLVETFVPEGPIHLAVDETLERRRGPSIKARAVYHDAVRSSKNHFVKSTALRWVCFMLLVRVRWSERSWALPFLSILAPSERYHQQRGRKHRTFLDRARQGLHLIHRWLPERVLILVADSSYACLAWLASVKDFATVITRLRLDAALYGPVPSGQKRGRKRKKGERLPKLAELAAEKSSRRWKRIRISLWYGERDREIEIRTGCALWYHSGQPVLPIRWVLVRDPLGKFDPVALLSTDEQMEAGQIVCAFVGRWQVEVTFEEVRAHLGVETQRQWSDKAIARTTPVLLGLFSVVTLAAEQLLAGEEMPVRKAAWYAKSNATFSDALALVRLHLWRQMRICTSADKPRDAKTRDPMFEHLLTTLCYAR